VFIIIVGMIINQCVWYLERGLQVRTAGKYIEYKKDIKQEVKKIAFLRKRKAEALREIRTQK
jgi:hypothetical protein